MTEGLLNFILQRLDQVESPVFLHRELVCYPEEEFCTLREKAILRETSRATEIPRPKRFPSGGDLIVRQTSRGLFGVAGEDDYFDPIPLREDDVQQYEFSLPKFIAAIRLANGIQGIGFAHHHGLISLGQKVLGDSVTLNIFLSIPNQNEDEFISRCRRLERPIDVANSVVLTPRTLMISPENQQQMKRLGIVTAAITPNLSSDSLLLDWQVIAKKASLLVAHQFDQDCQNLIGNESKGDSVDIITDQIIIERKKIDEKIHWIVNGVDKGPVYVRSDTICAKITEILYDQIGHGWVLHKTFMYACAWKKDEYFPASGDPGRMQRQLNNIRKKLGVAIDFRKEKGVRFPENIVKSK